MFAPKIYVIFTCILIIAFMFVSCKPKTVQTDTGTGDGSNVTGTTNDTGVGDITLTTSDGYTIAGTFMDGEGEGKRPAVLLIHMLGSDRHAYDELQSKLALKGISSLSIDLRGHGDSTAGGTLDYKAFTIEEWQAALNDLRAGMENLKARDNVDPKLTGMIGASIGANMAVALAADEFLSGAQNPPNALVLLSPGLNYKEYQPLEGGLIHELRRIPVFIVSSPGDAQSYPGSQAMSQASKGTLREFEGNGHGTALFETHPELMDEIANWLYDRVANQAGADETAPTNIDEPASTGDGATTGQ